MLLVCLACVSTAGCGGCGGPAAIDTTKWGGMSEEEWRSQFEAKQKAQKEEDAKQAAAMKAAREAKAAAAKAAQVSKRAGALRVPVAKKAEKATAKKEPTLPELPNDLVEWQDDDFFLARHVGDKRLTAALEVRAKSSIGKASEAKFFLSLLDPAVPASLQEVLGEKAVIDVGNQVQAAPLFVAVTAALSLNDTPAAVDALTRLAGGELDTANARFVADAAIKALAENANPKSESVLLKILLTPPAPVSGVAAKAPDAQRVRVAGLFRASASRSLRVEIARTLLDPALTPETRALLSGIIKDPLPCNFDAQLTLYGGTAVDAATCGGIERYLIASSSDTLGWLLGVPGKIAVGTDPDWPKLVVRRLWCDAFAEKLGRRLAAARSIQEGSGAFSLAAAMPSDAMRQNLLQTLVRHWDDGPAAVQAALAVPSLVTEPGLILTLKAAERKAGYAKANNTMVSRRNAPRDAAARTAWEQYKAKLKADWDKTIEEVMRRQRGVLRGMAAARQEAALASGERPASEVKPPVALHSDTAIVASLQLDCATEFASRVAASKPDPLGVVYLRIEGRQSMTRLQQWYRRQLRGADEHKVAEGTWFAALTTLDDGRKQSIDVLIADAKVIPGRPADEEREMTVEIVVVEANNPENRSAAGDEAENP